MKSPYVANSSVRNVASANTAVAFSSQVMLACMLQKYVVSEVPGEENDLDSFLPNRFVAWPASNKVTLKLATRFQVQANEKLFERTENRPSDVSRQSSLSARFFINPLS